MKVPAVSIIYPIWKVKKRIKNLFILKQAIQENEYWRGYQDSLDHVIKLLERVEYEERRKLVEPK